MGICNKVAGMIGVFLLYILLFNKSSVWLDQLAILKAKDFLTTIGVGREVVGPPVTSDARTYHEKRERCSILDHPAAAVSASSDGQ
jgi:hypothetical protein